MFLTLISYGWKNPDRSQNREIIHPKYGMLASPLVNEKENYGYVNHESHFGGI